MKKFITLLLFVLFVSVNAYSQTAARKYEYAAVKFYYNEIKIFYGNNKVQDFSVIKNIKIKAGIWDNVNNCVDAFNYMDEQGFELVSTVSNAADRFEYVFKREIKK